VPLWRGDHEVLLQAIRDGVALLTWQQDTSPTPTQMTATMHFNKP
jgi:hypothetical protein